MSAIALAVAATSLNAAGGGGSEDNSSSGSRGSSRLCSRPFCGGALTPFGLSRSASSSPVKDGDCGGTPGLRVFNGGAGGRAVGALFGGIGGIAAYGAVLSALRGAAGGSLSRLKYSSGESTWTGAEGGGAGGRGGGVPGAGTRLSSAVAITLFTYCSEGRSGIAVTRSNSFNGSSRSRPGTVSSSQVGSRDAGGGGAELGREFGLGRTFLIMPALSRRRAAKHHPRDTTPLNMR